MNHSNPKLSIVIPVYNLENYIANCLNSLLHSSNDHFEVIIVDDGSEDTSLEICNSFSSRDSRVVVLSQDNSGVSNARNKGIRLCRGEYITFVDGDDTVESYYIDSIFSFIEQNNSDVIVSGYNRISSTNPYVVKSTREKLFSTFRDFYYSGYYEYPCWAYVFRRSLLYDNEVFFPIGIKIGEDQVFNIKALVNANNIGINNTVIYNYFDRDSSALATTNRFAKANYQMSLMKIVQSILFGNPINKKNIFSSILITNMFFDFLIHFSKCNKKERQELNEKFTNDVLVELNDNLYKLCFLMIQFLSIHPDLSVSSNPSIQFIRRKVSFILKKVF